MLWRPHLAQTQGMKYVFINENFYLSIWNTQSRVWFCLRYQKTWESILTLCQVIWLKSSLECLKGLNKRFKHSNDISKYVKCMAKPLVQNLYQSFHNTLQSFRVTLSWSITLVKCRANMQKNRIYATEKSLHFNSLIFP